MEHGCCYLHQQILLRLIFFLLLGFYIFYSGNLHRELDKLIHD
jgi:hypothetical protein